MPREYKVFRTERKGPVFWVVMTNTKKRNSMGIDFWAELPQVFAEAAADDEARAVVLAAEGKSFCAGMDVLGLAAEVPMLMSGEAGGRAKKTFFDLIQRFQKTTSLPETCSKPVIAAIQGHCVGGGLDLAAACDVRLACRDALFSVREAAVAMLADLGSLQRLAGIIGEGHLREMAFTAGDVNGVCDDLDSLWAAAQAMGEKIAANSPLAVEATKEVLNWSRGRPVEEGLEYAAWRQTALLPNPDLFEAVAAFAERRKPVYGKK